MIIQRNDARFWDVRLLERRVRRNELTRKDLEAQLASLPDVADKATESKPLEEPDERRAERRSMVRVTAAPVRAAGDDDLFDEELIDDEDDEDEDEDEDEDV